MSTAQPKKTHLLNFWLFEIHSLHTRLSQDINWAVQEAEHDAEAVIQRFKTFTRHKTGFILQEDVTD